jgi:hypothetical protein
MTTPTNEQPNQVSSSTTSELHIPAPAIEQIPAVAAPLEAEKFSETADAADVAVASAAVVTTETETDAAAAIPASTEKPAKPAKRIFAVSGIEGFVNSKKHGKPFAVMRTKGYPEVFAIGSPELDARIRAEARKKGKPLKQREVQEINDELRSQAEELGVDVDLYPRVSPLKDGGVEIDLNDGAGTTVLITAAGVVVAKGTSETLFMRASSSLPLPIPADTGDFSLLWKYVNLKSDAFLLYIAWVTYTITRPKTESSKYVFLVLKGSQGTGKTFASKTTKDVIDPNTVNAQTLPGSSRDLAIMLQLVHLLVVDNMRDLTTAISDMLCIAATGGAVPMRKLYSDDEQKALFLHGAVLFNGIHPFVGQSDFADRCLVLELVPIEPETRKSEGAMLAEFEADRPEILKGLYDLISNILQVLPDTKVVAPSRMLDFCQWLSGMETAMGLPVGKLQYLYAASLKDSQLESLLDNPLAVTIIEFAEKMEEPEWIGKPSDFYSELTTLSEFSSQRSRAWPSCAAVLSKRLHGLQAPLMAQGISIDWTRGKDRQIVVRIPAEMCKQKESSPTDGKKSNLTQNQIDLVKAGVPYRAAGESNAPGLKHDDQTIAPDAVGSQS